MSADIENFVQSCEMCQQFLKANQKEPMLISAIPPLPWHTVSVDLFNYANQDYLIAVDNYSFYWEISPLVSTSAVAVARALFSIFQHFGLPVVLRSDNGTQLTSFDFAEILKRHGIQQITSSPYHPKGNSIAERAVQEAKKILRKVRYGSIEYYNAVMEWRNIPRNEKLGSPMQRLMSRRARTTVPVVPLALQPEVIPPQQVVQLLQEEREKQKKYYDQHARPLTAFKERDQVRLFDRNEGIWKPGTIVRVLSQPRSYSVQDDESGTIRRRNRAMLRERKAVAQRGGSPMYYSAESAPSSPEPSPLNSAGVRESRDLTQQDAGEASQHTPRRSKRIESRKARSTRTACSLGDCATGPN